MSTPTLLLADDSLTIQRLVELTFAKEDIAVVVTADGEQAISVLGHTTPDIVLADVGMPKRDGYELARFIKNTPALARVPVVLLTGAFEPVDPDRAREVGADSVMAKPFEPQALVAKVHELLKARRQDAPAPPAPRPVEAERLDDYFDGLDRALQSRVVAATTGAPVAATLPPLIVEAPAPITADVESEPTPVLAGAFSALLAAEQAGAEPDAFAEWLPEAPAPVSPAAAVITDEVIDRIVERVLARLPEQIVRQAVHDAAREIASTTAERLVREEIERIKSHIK